jgi:hypothetical protein
VKIHRVIAFTGPGKIRLLLPDREMTVDVFPVAIRSTQTEKGISELAVSNNVSAYGIGANGALTPAPGSPFPARGKPASVAITRLLRGIALPFVDDPGGKIAFGLLRCSVRGQLWDFHGLNVYTDGTPAPTNSHVFRQLLGKLNHGCV